MSRLSPYTPVTPRRLGAKFRPANSAERRLAPLRHFGIADNRFATRDVVRQVVQFFRDAAQYLLDVRLDGDICQSSRMVGLRMIIVRTTHTDETPRPGERHPALVNLSRQAMPFRCRPGAY
jgi:hypothetical protein